MKKMGLEWGRIKDFSLRYKKLLLFLSSLLLLFLLWFFLFFLVQVKSLSSERRRLRALREKMREVERGEDVSVLRESTESLRKQIERLRDRLIDSKQNTALLEYISTSAKKAQTKIIGMEPLKGKEKEGAYFPLFIRINIEGEFEGLLRFLSYLEGCNKFIQIDKFSIERDEAGFKARFVLRSFITDQGSTSKVCYLKEKGLLSTSSPSARVSKPFFRNIHNLSDIRLQGITYSPQGAVALINGHIVEEGEQLGEFRLEAIEKGGVIRLIREDKEYNLRLRGENE